MKKKKTFFNHYRRSDILPLSTRPLLSLNFKWSVLNMRSEIYTFTLRECNQQIPCQVHLAISITLLNFRLHWRRPSTTFWIQALVPSRNSSLNLFYAEALFAFFKGLPKYYRSFLFRISCISWAMGYSSRGPSWLWILWGPRVPSGYGVGCIFCVPWSSHFRTKTLLRLRQFKPDLWKIIHLRLDIKFKYFIK